MDKKLINILLVFLFGSIAISAQPVITSDQLNPVVGDVFNLQNTSITKFNDPGAGGSKVVWDYSEMVDSGSMFNISVLSPVGLLGADNFPTANIALLNSTQPVYSFYIADSSSFGQVGQYDTFFNRPNGFLPEAAKVKFPLKYNDVYTDSFNYTDPSFPAGYSVTGYDTIKVDSYGTLKLPKYTFYNVLRQKANTTTVLYFNGVPVEKSKQTIYDFGVAGIHHPILELASTSYKSGSWSAFYYSDSPLSLKVSSFILSWQGNNPYLQWSADNTGNISVFNIQRSLDGNTFRNVSQVEATIGSDYHFVDNFSPTAIVYYRLQEVDKAGQIFYSNTLQLSKTSKQLLVYPNPSKSVLHLSIPDGSQVSVLIYDEIGRLVYDNRSFTASDVIYTNLWNPGTYRIRIKDNIGWQTRSFVKE